MWKPLFTDKWEAQYYKDGKPEEIRIFNPKEFNRPKGNTPVPDGNTDVSPPLTPEAKHVLLYNYAVDGVVDGPSLWAKIPQQLDNTIVDRVLLSRPIVGLSHTSNIYGFMYQTASANVSDFNEIAFWLKSNSIADGTREFPHFVFLRLDSFEKNRLLGIPIHQPWQWEYKRIPLEPAFFEKPVAEVARPQNLKIWLFPRPVSQARKLPDLTVEIGPFFLARPQPLQDVQDALRRMITQILDQRRTQFSVPVEQVEVLNSPSNPNTQAIRQMVIQLRLHMARPDPQRRIWDKDRDIFVYTIPDDLKRPSEPVSTGMRSPAVPYDVYFHLHILCPKDPESRKTSFHIKDAILHTIARQPWLWIAGRKVPLLIQPLPEQERRQDGADMPFLWLKAATWEDSGDLDYFPGLGKQDFQPEFIRTLAPISNEENTTNPPPAKEPDFFKESEPKK